MKYPDLMCRMAFKAKLSSSLQAWLGHELETRGIDGGIYTRYIIGLLQQDSTESDESDDELSCLWPLKAESGRINQKKSHRKKSSNYSEEDRKKLAAIEYLVNICEDAEGIENLVEELFLKLKQTKYKIDKEKWKEKTSSNGKAPCQHSSLSPTKTQNAAERYCKAFPDLHGKISAVSIPSGGAHSIWKYNPISICHRKDRRDYDQKAVKNSSRDRTTSLKTSGQFCLNANFDSRQNETEEPKGQAYSLSSTHSRFIQRKRPYKKLKQQSKGKHRNYASKIPKGSSRDGLLKDDASQKSPKYKSPRTEKSTFCNTDNDRCKQLERMLKEILFQPRDFSSPNYANPVRNKDSDSGWVTTSECTPVIGLIESENKENEYWYTQPLEDVPFQADAPKHLYKRHSYPPSAHNSVKEDEFVVNPTMVLCEETFWHFDDDVFVPFPLDVHDDDNGQLEEQHRLLMNGVLEDGFYHMSNGSCSIHELWNSSDESGLEADKNTDHSYLVDGSDSPGAYSSFSDTSQVVTESALSVLDSSPEEKVSEENPVTLVDSDYLMASLGISNKNCLIDSDLLDIQILPDLDKFEDDVLTLLDSDYLLQSFNMDSAELLPVTFPETPATENETDTEKSSITLLDPNYLLHFTNVFSESADCLLDGYSLFEKVRYPSVLPDLMLPREWPLKRDIWNECLFVNSFENTKYSLPENNSMLQQLWNINIQRNKRWSFSWSDEQSNDLFNSGLPCMDSYPQNKSCTFLCNTGNSPSYNTLIPEISLAGINGENTSGSVLHFCSPVKHSYSDCMKNVSLSEVHNLWSFTGLDKYSSLSKSFDLIPSESSAFDGVIPRARSIHHVLSEPILSQCVREINPYYTKSHSSCNAYKEHLYFSAATHFRPIQSPSITPVTEDAYSINKDLFGGSGQETESPYQHYHKEDEEENDSFIPKFKLQSDRNKYIQTGRSLDEESSNEENDVAQSLENKNEEVVVSDCSQLEHEDYQCGEESIDLGVSEIDLESCVNMICGDEDTPRENVPFPNFNQLNGDTESSFCIEKEVFSSNCDKNPEWKPDAATSELQNPLEKTYGIWSFGNEKYIPFIEDFISETQEETMRMTDVCDVNVDTSFYGQEVPNTEGPISENTLFYGQEVGNTECPMSENNPKCIDYARDNEEFDHAKINKEKDIWDKPASPVENKAIDVEMDPYTAFMQFDESLIFQFSDDLDSEKINLIQGAVFSTDLEKEWLNSGEMQKSKQKLKSRFAKKPCTFYMEGNCDRTECRYSHDLSSITCRFWEDGCCFKGGTCPFRHGKYKHVNESSRPSPSALGLPKQRF